MQLDPIAFTTLIIGVISIISGFVAGVRWLVKHYFEEIKHELKPNSGNSLKDQVNRMENDILDLKQQNLKGEQFHEKLDTKIDKLTEMFIEYVAKK